MLERDDWDRSVIIKEKSRLRYQRWPTEYLKNTNKNENKKLKNKKEREVRCLSNIKAHCVI